MTNAIDYRGSDSREYGFSYGPEMPHDEYVNGLAENDPQYIEAGIQELENYANRLAETHVASQEAQAVAISVEQTRMPEMSKAEYEQFGSTAAYMGEAVQRLRDLSKADFDLAA